MQALKLALAGVDYQTIADKVGYKSKQAAWKAVKSALDKTTKAAAEDVKEMQLLRLDQMLKAIWANVLNGNFGAIDRALKIEERRARLLGMDAPYKIAPTDPTGKESYELITEQRKNALLGSIANIIADSNEREPDASETS